MCWLHLEDDLPVPLRHFLDAVLCHRDELVAVAGLKSSEVQIQLALYPGDGARYVRHRDTYPGGPQRTLTCVYYLNDTWQQGDGGELRLHLPGGPVDVAPIADRLVMFWSAWLDHEVLPTSVPRMALTVWLK
jgi:SM-20-related protein